MKAMKLIAGIISAYGLAHLSACSDYVQKMEDEHDVWKIQQSLDLDERSSSSVSTVELSSSAKPVSSSVVVVSSSSEFSANEESGEKLSSLAQSSSSIADNLVSSSSEHVLSSSSAVSGSTVSLAASSNIAYAYNIYATWKGFHYVTLENESVYYSDIAEDFGDVFTDDYKPAGRVIWAGMTAGAYRNMCSDENTSSTNMKYRGCTVSEGTGYGMLLAYFNGDDDAFIRLWNYSRAFRNYFGQDLTPWITYSFHYNTVDYYSATDADMDIATALILMYYKTNEVAYLTDALKIVNAIWEYEINKSSLLIYSGDADMWKGGNEKEPVYNLSYFSPVALRLFAQVDPSHNWSGVLDAMYAYMAKVQASGTGVFPDWSNASGVAANPGNGSADRTYWTFNKESVRIPWRIAWDYYWYNEPRALAILQMLNNFIVTKSMGDPSSSALGTYYSWSPTENDITGSGTVPVQWLAAWCATGIGNNDAWLNSCTTNVNSKMPTNSNTSYYADVLLTVYSALLNGAFVKPF